MAVPFNYNFNSTLGAGQLSRLGGTTPFDAWAKITQTVSEAPWKTPEQLVSEPASAAEAGQAHQPIHGQVIPVFRGTVKGGRVFWFNGPDRRSNGAVYADFAVAIARNEWQEPGVLLDVMADDTLIYDAHRGGKTRGRFTLRIYDGIENDFESVMLAENGVSQTPAYHGLIYLFFEDFRCTEYGDRIPIIQAEWTDTPEAAAGTDDTLPLLATTALGYVQNFPWLCYDRSLNEFYNYYEKTGEPNELYIGVTAFDEYSILGQAREVSLAKLVNKPAADLNFLFGACALRGTGLFICTGESASNSWDLLVDAQTGAVLATLNDGAGEAVEWWSALRFLSGSANKFIAAGQIWDSATSPDCPLAFALVNVSDSSIEYLQFGTDDIGGDSANPRLTPGFADETGTVFYMVTGAVGGAVYEARFTEEDEPAYAVIYTPAVGDWIEKIFYDAGLDTIAITVETAANTTELRRINPATGAVVWSIQVDPGDNGPQVVPGGGAYNNLQESVPTHRLRPGYALQQDGGTLELVDLVDGSTTDLGQIGGSFPTHYDQYFGSLYLLEEDQWITTGSSRWEPGELTIEEILTDFSTYDGLLTEAQVVCVGLDGLTCHGAYIDRDTDLRQSVAKICELYGIDKVETGTGVKFIKKTTGDLFDPDVEIAEADLVEARSGDITTIIQSRRKSETEIPQEVEIQYRDVDLDFNVSTVSASRPTGVFQSTQSTLRKTLDVPLVLDATKATQLASPLLYRHVTGQVAHTFTISRRHIAVEPSDVLEVAADGYVRLLKTLRAVKRADHCQDITAEEYLSTADVTVIAPVPILQGTPVVGTGYARYIHLDTALLRYSHDLGGAGIVSYAVLTSRGLSDWPGASLWRRRAGSEWDNPYLVGSPAPTVCVAQAALPAPLVTFETDMVNTLPIRLLTGDGAEISDVTYLEMMNGANRAALGRPGRWMILAYQNVTVGSPSDGTFVLETILQGLRGTEIFQGTSQAGDFFIPLRPDLFGAVQYDVADLDDAIQYKARGFGVDFDDVAIDTHVVSGAAETPYAPASLDAVIDGVDIDLSWVRRTRLMWEWYDEGSAVEGPLGETVELYKVEILDGPAGAVLRTYTDEPLETKTYVAAHITADFGSMPAVLTFRVSQWSAVVGWGYVAEATVPLV